MGTGTPGDSPAGRLSDEDEQRLQELATRVYALARSGDAESLAAYLNAGLPANLTNERGDTLIMLASYHGHAAAVRVLLAHGADPDRLNDRGQTPLAGAVFKAEDEVVRLLIEAGADPHAGHPCALDAAQMFGRADYLTLLGRPPGGLRPQTSDPGTF
ncbi:ankyrin repeat domain-containing protein [Rhodococcus sp. D2-41]|uniref:Ankyrin repeat domain-containing protein n=1 Tax=Speluncibacter jeojiensis TaxID=2710754 RepID=A0A9X4RCT9_9ACTN|nr:ankyrin repeat domain-containing protein [Rhodococcus sp. D2-41]MDG3010463.1 ankyrin repeat domain-containing protein [Rhodococcus sp. D2-41]MDG3014210.1 ankyrin repeat domain-containing protein [Corynebacteriales bacterium D3-21]